MSRTSNLRSNHLQLQHNHKSRQLRCLFSHLLSTCRPIPKSSAHLLVQHKVDFKMTLTTINSASHHQLISSTTKATETLSLLIRLLKLEHHHYNSPTSCSKITPVWSTEQDLSQVTQTPCHSTTATRQLLVNLIQFSICLRLHSISNNSSKILICSNSHSCSITLHRSHIKCLISNLLQCRCQCPSSQTTTNWSVNSRPLTLMRPNSNNRWRNSICSPAKPLRFNKIVHNRRNSSLRGRTRLLNWQLVISHLVANEMLCQLNDE